MDRTFSGKIWKMPDDVDTDTIIPGKRGTIPNIKEMSNFAFEHLRPEFAATVQPGDIIVAGKNFGCGSSREQAAGVIAAKGVTCIIAKSFARIFFRNGFNSGILLIECDKIQDLCSDGDVVTVEVNQCVRVNGHEFPVKKIPDNLFEIVQDGGLVNNCRKRLGLAKEVK